MSSNSLSRNRNQKPNRVIWLALACALVAASAAMAFQAEPPKPVDPNAGKPNKDADLPPEIAKLPFEIRDGYRKFNKRCTTCHDQKRVIEAKHSLFDWQGVIGTMSFKKDANIPMEDRQGIFLYLSYLHGTTHNKPEEKDEDMSFLTKCEDCHGVGLVYRDKKKMMEWPGIVHRMAGKTRANITPEDEKKIMNYIGRMQPDVFGID
jgi:hypothetical protein